MKPFDRARAWRRRLDAPVCAAAVVVSAAAWIVLAEVPKLQEHTASERTTAATSKAAALHASRAVTRAVDSPETAFVASFPAADTRAKRLTRLLGLARASGLSFTHVELAAPALERDTLVRAPVTLPARGTYAALQRFIAQALEADPFTSLDALQMRRAPGQADVLEIELRLSLFARSAEDDAP